MQAKRPWVIAAPASTLASLEPLLTARALRQPVVVLANHVEAVLADPALHLPPNAEALLVVGPIRRGPRRTLTGLWVTDSAGQNVPVGWLPASISRLAGYAKAAARVLARQRQVGPVAVLGQWEDRFLRSALRTSRWFEKQAEGPRVFHWTADRISRTDMIEALATGPGAAVYYGHGRANGWAGYHGVRTSHFPLSGGEPIGALLTLCCENACRRGGRFSFIEELVLRGICAGALAGAGKTKHQKNRELGPALNEALSAGGATTLAELVAAAKVSEDFWRNTPYRFIGDPAIPLHGAAECVQRAENVYAPAPDEPLPPWPDLQEENPVAGFEIATV
jgi:Peptidase family C25